MAMSKIKCYPTQTCTLYDNWICFYLLISHWFSLCLTSLIIVINTFIFRIKLLLECPSQENKQYQSLLFFIKNTQNIIPVISEASTVEKVTKWSKTTKCLLSTQLTAVRSVHLFVQKAVQIGKTDYLKQSDILCEQMLINFWGKRLKDLSLISRFYVLLCYQSHLPLG